MFDLTQKVVTSSSVTIDYKQNSIMYKQLSSLRCQPLQTYLGFKLVGNISGNPNHRHCLAYGYIVGSTFVK